MLGGNLKLVKSGTGTLTLSAVTRTYTGGRLVCAGGKLKLGASNKSILGTGTITIEDGAAIDFNGCLNGVKDGMPAIYAAGTGPDGTGAILNTGTQFGNNGFSNLYLTGDLLVYAQSRMKFVTVHTQGHTLRYKGATQSAFTTIDNSQGGDVSIESNQYTAWNSNNCLGNTPSKGKAYLRGGILNFHGSRTVPNDIVVENGGKIRQGANATATMTGTVTLNNGVTIDGNYKIKFKGKIVSPTATKTLQISDGNVDVNFDGCFVTNTTMQIYRGTVSLGSGTTIYSPNGVIRHLMQASASSQIFNQQSTFNIADGSDTTIGYFVSGNSSSATAITGIVNQVGGTFRTVSCYPPPERRNSSWSLFQLDDLMEHFRWKAYRRWRQQQPKPVNQWTQ